jgi:glycosyltransferase involved in cell wall biosynthesis
VTVSVSACVIAHEDERHIGRCLRSLAWAEERIVVVDARSADRTEEIARSLGARVLRHPYAGNVEQKSFALAQASGDWVLAFDADEALSQELSRRLEALLRSAPPDLDGVALNRVTFHLGRWIRHGDFHPDWQVRALRRGRGRWQGRNPHGRLCVQGAVRRLEGDLEHYSYRGLADQIERIQAFSGVEAERMFAEGRRARTRDLVLRPPARFLRGYALKRGFLDGMPGLVIAAATAFHVFLKYAKLWELERARGDSGERQ